MESPVQGRPNRETGLPPGVEVGPLGKRFVAFLINLSVPVVVDIALIFLLPNTTGALRVTLAVLGAVISIGWLVVIWYTLAIRAASPGLRAMKLQVVGFLDGRPIGPGRVFVRALVFWALYITGIGLLIMLIMMLRHPRKQGWHDLAVTSVMIKERVLAPPVQPARAASRRAGLSGTGRHQVAATAERRWLADTAELCTSGGLRACWQSCATRPADPAAWHGAGGLRSSVRHCCPAGGVGFAVRRQRVRVAVPGRAIRTAIRTSPTSQPSGGELYPPGQQAGERSQSAQGSPSGASAAYEDAAVVGGFSDQSAAAPGSSYVQDWSILLDDGRRIPLEGLVLLGRNPQPKAGEEDAQLIKIADETRTVSKSHLAVGVDAGGVYVVDRGSTNGSTVSTTNGMSSRCRAGEMVRVGDGAIVSIGDHWLEITRGA